MSLANITLNTDVWEERQQFAPYNYRPTQKQIDTAKDDIVPEDLFDMWQLQKRPIPLWDIKAETKKFRITKPISVNLYEDDGLFFAENETLFVCGHGETPEQAVIDLGLHILHHYQYYQKLSENDLIGDGIRLKKLYQDLLIEE